MINDLDSLMSASSNPLGLSS